MDEKICGGLKCPIHNRYMGLCLSCLEEQREKWKSDVEKVLDEISSSDMIWSETMKKMIDPWTIQGCAVFNILKQKLLGEKK